MIESKNGSASTRTGWRVWVLALLAIVLLLVVWRVTQSPFSDTRSDIFPEADSTTQAPR